jgi:site-specific recombinase XerD
MSEVIPYQGEQWERLKALALDGVSSPHSRRAYSKALDGFLVWYQLEPRPGLTKATVTAYRAYLENLGLSSSTINVRLAAIRKLVSEAADNGLLAPETAAGIARVRGAKRLGVRTGNWLPLQQAQALLQAPDITTPKGKRDRAILAVLIGCGLRRSEAAALAVEHVQQRDGRWVIVDLIGKGGRVRTVPVPAWVKVCLDCWSEAAGIDLGRLFRAVNKGGRIMGAGMTDKAIEQLVRLHSKAAGLTEIAPHDLRRTCAKLCRNAGGDLEQIQLLLGHASVETTERYLGTRQNLLNAPNDHLGIELS